MRTTALALNSIVVVFFSCFFAYTFIVRSHLDALGRDFVTEKTVSYSKPIVEIAHESLDSPLVRKLLSEDKALAIRNEIRDYRNDPAAYVSDLTHQPLRKLPLANANPLLAKVASIKEKIRTFYDDTLNALITDLRIFSVSNLIAGLIAFGLAYRSPRPIRNSIVWFSFLIFVAVLCCSSLYIDDLTFFRILFRTHMGWLYAVLLCVMTIALYWDYGRHINAAEQSDVDGATDRAVPSGPSAAVISGTQR
ncbi:MAG: hypothetical protein JWP89_1102 [Schlesneria sp.]|nr:hypothetical protein [Schlesneria sp.]